MRRPLHAGLLAATLGVTASIIAAPAKDIAPVPTNTVKQQHHWYQIGKASWYGSQFQGRTTADGEKFDMNAFTCAHRTLPLGTWLRVTNLRNHRSAFVRVNDRGPVPTSRILDLSYAAAHKLGVAGLAEVKIERVTATDPDLTDQLVADLEKPATPTSVR
ncbi:MAG TPA: septal ring lytic transglycosylase RlpA family protein [Acidobacteriaceae bacterium]|jgi:rare lipoprotein A